MRRTPEDHQLMFGTDVEAYAGMNFSEPHDAFVATFQRLFPDFVFGQVLDIGCGNADPTIRFAKVYPNVNVIGLDGSEEMLRHGNIAIAREGLTDRVQLRQGTIQDNFALPAQFDGIICNSVLHHVEPVSALWNAINHLAKRNAQVLVMDFMRPDTVEVAMALEEKYASDSSESMTRGFYNSLLAAYTPVEVYAQLVEAGLSMFKVELISDRHMIIFGRT